jgi:hypothetical protein
MRGITSSSFSSPNSPGDIEPSNHKTEEFKESKLESLLDESSLIFIHPLEAWGLKLGKRGKNLEVHSSHLKIDTSFHFISSMRFLLVVGVDLEQFLSCVGQEKKKT